MPALTSRMNGIKSPWTESSSTVNYAPIQAIHFQQANARSGGASHTSDRTCIPYVASSRLKASQEVTQGRSRRTSSPYFLLFPVDADRETRLPLASWSSYQDLHEGRPDRLRRCKVMIRAFGSEHWFLITTRYSQSGTRNCAVSEAMGRDWNGPLSVLRLDGRRETSPVGIATSEHHHAALAAVEL